MAQAESAINEPSALIVDASVTAKWLLRDEDDIAPADYILARAQARELRLSAPRQIDVEVTAGIRKAALLGRISSSEVTSTLEAWLELTQVLHLVENRRLLRPALRESLRWGVSLFDALYVSLAVIADTRLITGDRRLLRAGSDLAPHLLDLRSFTP